MKSSDKNHTASTRMLTRILNILYELDEPINITNLTLLISRGQESKVKDGLRWLENYGIIVKKKCKGNVFKYELNEKYWVFMSEA